MKEVKLKRVAGPFNNIPFESYIQSPIGLVPKAKDQTRLIFHLSYDCQRDQLGSLNHFMPRELCSVKYKDIDYAIQAYLRICNQADRENPRGNENSRRFLGDKWRNEFEYHKSKNRTVYTGKSDLKSAFRMIRLSSDSWPWLVMKARDPITNEWQFFVDKCLPFGASISCALFQRFSNALCYLFEYKTNTQGQVTNYLDDFLFLALTILGCNCLIRTFLNLCDQLGVPVSRKDQMGCGENSLSGYSFGWKEFYPGCPNREKRQSSPPFEGHDQ